MELSVGDKVRVYFYPPKNTESFVEGTVERTDIQTFYGPAFSIQMTREVILGHEGQTQRTLPYIIRYVKEDDFEGRIVVLETAAQLEPEPEQVSEAETVPEAVITLEAESVAEAEPTLEAEPLPEAEPGVTMESEPAPNPHIEAEPEPESQKRGWMRLFGRAA